jgi:hypothetical protein
MPGKWGVFPICQMAKTNRLIQLGSLPWLDAVLTYYSEYASRLRFSQFKNLMKLESKAVARVAGGLAAASPLAEGNGSGPCSKRGVSH